MPVTTAATVLHLHSALVLAVLASGLPLFNPNTAYTQEARNLTLGQPTAILAEHEFGSISEVAVANDGTLYILDGMNCEILKVSAHGGLLWRRGRAGDGPGEYRSPYRIAIRPNGGVAVFDWRHNRVTLLNGSGTVEASHRVPFWFSQVDGLKVSPNGRVILAGMTNWGGPAADHSVHVFSDSLRYLYSFGQHATARDTAVVRTVGSGMITTSARGDILLTLKRPFEIQRFDAATGKLLRRTVVDLPLSLDLSDIVEVRQFNASTVKSLTPLTNQVELPIPAYALPQGGFITGKAKYMHSTLVLVSPDGKPEAEAEPPRGFHGVLAVDAAGSALYVTNIDTEPALLRVPFTIGRGR